MYITIIYSCVQSKLQVSATGKPSCSKHVRKILEFERALVLARDTACHSVGEVEERYIKSREGAVIREVVTQRSDCGVSKQASIARSGGDAGY
jgi:hypothetical protein